MHKPGVVALRPLTLGDLFDGAFTTIRRNPTAMVGLAAGVSTVFLVVPAVLTLVLAATGGLSFDRSAGSNGEVSSLLASGGPTLLSYLGTLFGALATVVLNGMLVRVVAEAVLGRRTTAGQAWAATRGRLLRLVGLTAVNTLVALLLLGLPVAAGVLAGFTIGVGQGLLVGVPLLVAGVVALAFLQVRCFLLAAPALVLERTGVLASMRRAGRLSRGQFWRLFGIQLLTMLVVGLVGEIIAVPLGLVGALGPAPGLRDRGRTSAGLRRLPLTGGGQRRHHPVQLRRGRVAVRRPADPQGGPGRRADRGLAPGDAATTGSVLTMPG